MEKQVRGRKAGRWRERGKREKGTMNERRMGDHTDAEGAEDEKEVREEGTEERKEGAGGWGEGGRGRATTHFRLFLESNNGRQRRNRWYKSSL